MCGEDLIEIDVGPSTLYTSHMNLEYNCCIEPIEYRLQVEGNVLTLTEEEILFGFKNNVIPSIVKYEQETRRVLLKEKLTALDDKAWRALGVLQNVRAISSEEAMFLLSHLRMGVLLERIPDINLDVINELLLATQSAHLQKRHGQRFDGEHRSIVRADLIRDRLLRSGPSSN